MPKTVYESPLTDDCVQDEEFPELETWDDEFDDIADSLDIPVSRIYND